MSDQANSQSSFLQNPSPRRRALIVGGVAGGASCAARLRRLDESVEIIMFDRGPYVSFANCGLPYYVGNVISDERKLLVGSREMFRDRFNIEVHTDTEVTASTAAHARSRCAMGAPATAARSTTTRLCCPLGRRQSGRRCLESTCLACSRCAAFPTRAVSAHGLLIAAPKPRSSLVAASSAWRWSRT